MTRNRVQAIIIQDGNVLFGYGCISQEKMIFRHFFIGGGIEESETPEEAIIREIREEANVNGNIIFKFEHELYDDHATFLVDINDQTPILGFDPEEIQTPAEQRTLRELITIPLCNKSGFTGIDIDYFRLLLRECEERGYFPYWYKDMRKLISLFINNN